MTPPAIATSEAKLLMVIGAYRDRDPVRPSFMTDQTLVAAVETFAGWGKGKGKRVTASEAIAYAEGLMALQHRLSAAEEENKRLRDGLAEIADGKVGPENHWHAHWWRLVKMARELLTHKAAA